MLGGESWGVGVVNLAVLACVLRTKSKKGRHLLGENSALPEKIRGYAYAGSRTTVC